MTTTRTLTLALALAALGCQAAPEQHADDRMEAFLDAEAMSGLLDAHHSTEPREAPEPFVRLGLLWESAASAAPEVRMRAEGEWSPWAPATVVFSEGESHAGHLDAPDGLATHYQVRFPGGAPLSVAFDPIVELPDLAGEAPVEGYDPDEGDAVAPAAADGDVGARSDALSLSGFRIEGRRAWGARAPRCRSRNARPTRVTFHHTVTPTRDSVSPQRRLRLIQAYHMDSRGWCDIGYNYLISRDGRVWRGRGAAWLGAHVSNHNSGNVGVAFMGTHTRDRATLRQRRQAARTLVRLRRRGFPISLTRRDVKGHRDYGATSCPGDALYGQIGDILRRARSAG